MSCTKATNKKIQNRNTNLYFCQLFPNINEANNTKDDNSAFEKSILNKDDWFKRTSDRLNKFLRIENDNYEKPRLNYSYTSKDVAMFNHSLDITKFSTNDLVKTFGQEEDTTSKYKKRKSVVSERENLNKSTKNVVYNPLNLIHEIEYSDDVNIQIKRPKLRKKSSKKITKKKYSEIIRSKLFSGCYNQKKKALSTNKLKIEYHDKNKQSKKNIIPKMSTKCILKKHDPLNSLSPRFSSPILNKNYLSKGEDVYNTPLFLEDIEMLISINNQASMETYTSAMKFKTEKKKSCNTIKSKVTTSTKKSYANVILDHYKRNTLILPSDEVPKAMNQHNSVFSLKEEVMNLPKFEKTDIIKSIQSAQIDVPGIDKSSLNNTRKNNFDRKSSDNNTVVIKDKVYEEGESGLNMQGLKALLRKKRLIEFDSKGQRISSYSVKD